MKCITIQTNEKWQQVSYKFPQRFKIPLYTCKNNTFYTF